jgi:hypothetical protein
MSIVDKVKQMLGQHSDKAKEGVEKAGDVFDQRTGGKYADKVDRVQEQAEKYVDRGGGEGGQPGRPGGAGEQPGQPGRPGGAGEQPGGTGGQPA